MNGSGVIRPLGSGTQEGDCTNLRLHTVFRLADGLEVKPEWLIAEMT